MKIKCKFFIIITLLIIFIHTYSIADVGSFDRYDSGGSDWSSSDWGSSWDSDWDSDWSSSDYDSSGSDLFFLGAILGNGGIGTFIFIIIIYAIIRASKNSKGTDRARYNNARTRILTQNREPVVNVSQSHVFARKIQEFDPLFSEEKILSWAKNLFVKLQNAWTAREWEPMRPFETEELFEQHRSQVQGYINSNRINVMDRIAVNYACIYSFRKEANKDILEIALKSTMKDYIIDEKTKEVLEGNPNQDRTTVYKLTFERKSGVLTKEGEIELKTTNCPNCGAPTQVTSSGKCDYCASIITTRDYGWVLAGLEPLRN